MSVPCLPIVPATCCTGMGMRVMIVLVNALKPPACRLLRAARSPIATPCRATTMLAVLAVLCSPSTRATFGDRDIIVVVLI